MRKQKPSHKDRGRETKDIGGKVRNAMDGLILKAEGKAVMEHVPISQACKESKVISAATNIEGGSAM